MISPCSVSPCRQLPSTARRHPREIGRAAAIPVRSGRRRRASATVAVTILDPRHERVWLRIELEGAGSTKRLVPAYRTFPPGRQPRPAEFVACAVTADGVRVLDAGHVPNWTRPPHGWPPVEFGWGWPALSFPSLDDDVRVLRVWSWNGSGSDHVAKHRYLRGKERLWPHALDEKPLARWARAVWILEARVCER